MRPAPEGSIQRILFNGPPHLHLLHPQSEVTSDLEIRLRLFGLKSHGPSHLNFIV